MPNQSVTLRPNGVYKSSGYTIGGGAGSLNAATSDDSDSTYADASSATNALYLKMGTFTFPANSQIRRWRVRVRVSQASGSGKARFGWSLPETQKKEPTGTVWSTIKPTSTITTFERGWNTNFFGKAAKQIHIDAIQFYYRPESSSYADDHRIREAYIDVEYNEAPTVTVTAIGGTVTSSGGLLVQWDYDDPEGDPQEFFQVKVFDSVIYGGASFDPDTSIAEYDSGIIAGNDVEHYARKLRNGRTYKAYVKVSDLGSKQRWSDWDDTGAFTMSIDVPATPFLKAYASQTFEGIEVLVQERQNVLTENQASLETDTTGWNAGTNCSISRSTTVGGKHGSAALRLSSTASGNMDAVTGFVQINPTGFYQASGYVRSGVSARSCYLKAVLYHYDQTTVVGTVTGPSVTSTTSGWSRLDLYFDNDDYNGYFVKLFVCVTSTGAGSELHYFDQLGLSNAPLNFLNEAQAESNLSTSGWSVGANCTLSLSTSTPRSGDRCLQLTSSGSGDMYATTATGTGGVPVVVGENYSAMAWFAFSANGTVKNVRVSIAWYDAAGALLSVSDGSSVAEPSQYLSGDSLNDEWVKAYVDATAPASAAFAAVRVYVLSLSASGHNHLVDCVALTYKQDHDSALIDNNPLPPDFWFRGGIKDLVNIEIERSLDMGTTWALRYSTDQFGNDETNDFSTIDGYPVGMQSIAFVDTTAPRNEIVQYRARAIYDDDTNEVASLWSPTAEIVWTNDGNSYLMDCIFPYYSPTQLNVSPTFSDTYWSRARESDFGVFSPLGRNRKIKVTGQIRGHQTSITFLCTTQQDFDDLIDLYETGKTVVFHGVNGEYLFWQFVDVTEKVKLNNGHFLVDANLLEVSEPTYVPN